MVCLTVTPKISVAGRRAATDILGVKLFINTIHTCLLIDSLLIKNTST